MILANVRARFTRQDAQLVVALLALIESVSADALEARLREQGLDRLLDDPHLLTGLCGSPLGAAASLPLFSYVVARHALLQSGERDRVLADYAAAILLEFGLRDRAHRIADTDDEWYDTLVQLLADATGPDPRRTFLVRAHLGNYALWLAGLFPDYIEHRRWRRGGPALDYFDELGTRGFQLAAEHRVANEHGLTPLYQRAAERFAVIRVALNRVSDTLLFPSDNSPERLMRQVRDDGRWRAA
jgi:hypothetical protein